MALASQEQQDGQSPWAVASMLEVTDVPPVQPSINAAQLHRHVVAAPPPRGPQTPHVATSCTAQEPFVWLGAHGGAGVTSLATASRIGVALTGLWPTQALAWPAQVAVVCRTNTSGFDAAAHLIQEWASSSVLGVDVIALVVVADAPTKLTRSLKARLYELSGSVPHVFTVPWIATWRDIPSSPHSSVTKIAASLVALSHKENR